MNLPVGLLGLALSARHLARSGEALAAGFDLPGQLLGMLALTLLTFGLIEGGTAGWSSPRARSASHCSER